MNDEYTRFSDTFFSKLDRLAAQQSVAVLIGAHSYHRMPHPYHSGRT
jgi:N-formylglutamate amidohydrolase